MKLLLLSFLLCFSVDSLLCQTLYPITQAGKWGYIDSTGAIVIPLRYEDARDFGDDGGPAPVKVGGKWGFIDKGGLWVIAPRYLEVDAYRRDTVIPVLDNARWIWLKRKGGQPILETDLRSEHLYHSSFQWPDSHSRYQDLWERTILVDPDGRHSAIDSVANAILPFPVDKVIPYSRQMLVKLNGRWGSYDYGGHEMIPIRYLGLREIDSNYLAAGISSDYREIESNRGVKGDSALLWGVITRHGKVVVPFRYDEIGGRSGNQFFVIRDSLWGIADLEGREVVEPRYGRIMEIGAEYYGTALPDTFPSGITEMRHRFVNVLKVGILSRTGRLLIEPQWEMFAAPYGAVSVLYRREWGRTCLEVYDTIFYLSYSRIGTYVEPRWRLFGTPYAPALYRWDEEGETRLEVYGPLLRISRINRGEVYIRPDGSMAIGRFFMQAGDFGDGLAWVRTWSGREEFIDTAGNPVWYLDTLNREAHPAASSFSEGKIPISVDREGIFYYDRTGCSLFGPYDTASSFSEGLAAVRDSARTGSKLLGYIDTNGLWVIPPQFVVAGPFREGLASVAIEGKDMLQYGYIDRRGAWVIGPKFLQALPFSEHLGAVLVKVDSTGADSLAREVWQSDDFALSGLSIDRTRLWGFIDHSGRFIIEPQFISAKAFTGGIAQVGIDYGDWFIDSTGRVLEDSSQQLSEYPWHSDFTEGLARVSERYCVSYDARDPYLTGYINVKGEWTIPPQFLGGKDFHCGLAAVGMPDRSEPIMYINSAGTILWQKEGDER